MNIKINDQDVVLEQDEITISELLTHQQVKMPEMVSVEHNETIVDRQRFDTHTVTEGDEVNFLYFMGGGR